MELVVIVGPIVLILGFVAIAMARGSEKRTIEEHTNAKAELIRAQTERETTRDEAAVNRALTLSKARDHALSEILAADLANKNDVIAKIEERGGLSVEISNGNNDEDKGVPRISWTWTPFENAIIKVYRNEGTIFEEIKTVINKAMLVHAEQYEPKGDFHDLEARVGKTYNYYVFIETRRTGIRAAPITLDLPSEFSSGKVIDANGREITTFKTVQPETYEEPLYYGFRYRRITVKKYLDTQAQRKKSLGKKRERLELDEEEMELERLERELGLRSGKFDEAHIAKLIEEARRITQRSSAIDKAEAMLDAMELSEREREIIHAYVRKNAYR